MNQTTHPDVYPSIHVCFVTLHPTDDRAETQFMKALVKVIFQGKKQSGAGEVMGFTFAAAAAPPLVCWE